MARRKSRPDPQASPADGPGSREPGPWHLTPGTAVRGPPPYRVTAGPGRAAEGASRAQVSVRYIRSVSWVTKPIRS